MVVESVVFDVGETLINETRVFARWADRLGVPALTFFGVIGGVIAADRPLRDAFEIVRPGFDIDAEIAAWARAEPDSLRDAFDAEDLYPDVRESLAALRASGRRVIIAGNQPPHAGPALHAMGLPVDAVHTSAEWGVHKPDPEFFARVLDVCGHGPGEVLYVGDRLDNDVLPAKAAGIRAALLRRGPWGVLHAERSEAKRADLLLYGLPDLVSWLDFSS